MRPQKTILALSVLVIFMLLSACGKSSSGTASTAVYNVAYVPGTGMNAPVEGKTTFQLDITKRSDGSPATGLSPAVTLTMTMTDGMTHATPIDSVTESTTSPGTYNCTVYYLMASGPTMGTWEMDVTVGGETTTFTPDVAMAMGNDTWRATLYGPDDIVSGMSGTSYNKYYLFKDGMLSASTPTLALYISHGESMNMHFVPLSSGSVLSSPTGTVTAVSVQASQDSAFTTPLTAVDNGDGHWTVSGLTGLVSGQTTTIYVKLGVNGQDKTTNGATTSGTNAYATFIVTPQ